MILPTPKDAIHKLQMYRLLSAILDRKELAYRLYFKGGTAAAMLGWLDRFSIDLDFDIDKDTDKKMVREDLSTIFKSLALEIKSQNKIALFYVLTYQAKVRMRNTLKLGITDNSIKANEYQPFYFHEIDRYAWCQTKETMFANKLVSIIDRFEKFKTIAGRDLYDIHHFFSLGFTYKKEIIEERKKTDTVTYLQKLKRFIMYKVTEKVITEDLSYLLPFKRFNVIRKILKQEVLMLIDDEIRRQSKHLSS